MRPSPKLGAISQNLPPEILSYIFTIGADYVYLPPPADRYPWILGHVCSYWREVLWNTRSVWSKIETSNPETDYPFLNKHIETIRKRTITEMLVFILDKIDFPVLLIVHEAMDFCLDIIIEQSKRFSSLYLFDVSEEAILTLLHLPPDAFPVLEHFTFATSSAGCLIFDCVTSPFHTAPKLRSIECILNSAYDELEISYNPLNVPFSFSNLEEITIGAIALSCTEVHDIWKTSPNLRSCDLILRSSTSAGVHTTQQIVLSTLQTLTLGTSHFHDWDNILGPIMTPALQNLFIQALNFPAHPLISLVSRSHCLLKKLEINEESDEEDIIGSAAHDFFRHFTVATTLTVPWTLSTSAVQIITDGLLPNLVRAEFRVLPQALSALLDMIDLYIKQSRRPPYFHVTCNRGPGFNEVRERYLTRRGLYEVEGVKVDVYDGETYRKFSEDLDFDYSGVTDENYYYDE